MQIKVIIGNVRYCRILLLVCFFLLFSSVCNAQHFELVNNRKRVSMPFKLVRNMVVVKLNINNRGPYNFILDTGVGVMLITDPKMADMLELTSKRTIKIYGLDGQYHEAYVTPTLDIELPALKSQNVAAAILKEDHFGLSNYAGMHIHGLIGYDFFNSLAVKINFTDSTLTVSKPQYIRQLRKGIKLPITIEERKPYLETWVKMNEGRLSKCKLIVDIGAGHPLSLDNMFKGDNLPDNFITANLGLGLTGPITGFISRVNQIELGKYKLTNVITSFPDNESLLKHIYAVPRDGNIGLGILKKFTLIFDYSNGALYLKKGQLYNEPFEHDMSGMEYYFSGEDFSRLVVGRIEPGSAADEAGLQAGDEIEAINFKSVSKIDVEQIDKLFRSRHGRNLLLEIQRKKEYARVLLTLKRRI